MTGHCKVDQTEKGWFIQYIDRDPETIERQKVTRNRQLRFGSQFKVLFHFYFIVILQ